MLLPTIHMARPGGLQAPSMYKFLRVCITAFVCALLVVNACESALKKPVAKRPVVAKRVPAKAVAKNPVVAKPVPAKPVAKKPVAAKPVPVKAPVAATGVLTVVAGEPFEPVPTNGPSKVAITLCPEETAAATFTVRSVKPLKSVRVVAGDFMGPGKISKANVTVRMVSGQDLLSCESIDIGSTPVQLWVNIAGPKDAKAGVYVGAVVFSAQGKVVDRVLLQAAVLPLRLIGSSKQYAIYTTLGPGAPGSSELSGDAYSKFLASAVKLGFRAVSVNAEPSKVGEAFVACASAGLLGTAPVLSFAWGSTVPSLDQLKALENLRKSSGLKSLYCFCASNPSSDAEVSAALEKASLLHQARAQVAATVSDDAVTLKLMSALDGVNYKYDMPYVQALIAGGTNRTTKWEWYWWDARQSVSENRVYSGIALWKSGLYGCMPLWTPKDDADKADSLDSLLCEAMREGINDTRYMTTYMKALRELKDKKRGPDKEYIASTEAYLAGFLSKPFNKLTAADLRSFRAKVAEFSIKLAAML